MTPYQEGVGSGDLLKCDEDGVPHLIQEIELVTEYGHTNFLIATCAGFPALRLTESEMGHAMGLGPVAIAKVIEMGADAWGSFALDERLTDYVQRELQLPGMIRNSVQNIIR